MRLWPLILCLLAAPAGAETYADAYGLGSHAPDPERGGSMGSVLHINAAILRADGSPAGHVTSREVLHLSLTASRAMDRPAVKVKLRCSASFTDADGADSTAVEGICFDGEIPPGPPVPLRLTLEFRGNPDDRAETYGISVEVKDQISGAHVTLMPTWAWDGGRK